MFINVCNLIQSQQLDSQVFLRGKFSLAHKGVRLGVYSKKETTEVWSPWSIGNESWKSVEFLETARGEI